MRMRADAMRGFTLIELMVVVAVVAILAAIAYPSYQDAVRKSKRAQAKADLAELAQRFERWHTVNNTYEKFWTTTNVPAAQRLSPKGSGAAYDLAASSITRNTYILSATPKSGTPQMKDRLCMTLILDHAGSKTISGGTGEPTDCW